MSDRLKPTKPTEQTAAMDVLIRAALTSDRSPLSSELPVMLGSLPREAGKRVANILIMMACAAATEGEDWREILTEHLAGSSGVEVLMDD